MMKPADMPILIVVSVGAGIFLIAHFGTWWAWLVGIILIIIGILALVFAIVGSSSETPELTYEYEREHCPNKEAFPDAVEGYWSIPSDPELPGDRLVRCKCCGYGTLYDPRSLNSTGQHP